MNFSQLEYFVYAAELGSFALASKASFVNPSTISLAVSNLEKELGVKLLIRSSNGVTLTEAGSEFFDQSSAALNSIKNLKNFPQTRVAQENAGELILGIATDFWDGNVISDRVLNSFERAFPGIAVSIFNASSVECLKALNRSIVDTAVVVGAADEGKYDYTRLFGKKVSLLVGAENPLASEKEIRINDLFDVPIAMPSDIGYLYDKIVSLYAVHGRSPNFKFIPHDYEAIMDFFRSQRLSLIHI